MRSKYRLGIDAGGTFTDFVLVQNTGEVRLYKSLSTPQDGSISIKNGLQQISEDIGESVEEIIQQCDLCVNGTTVALNALIEKKGEKIGLICTAGHEDSVEIRLGHKEEGYRYDSSYPPAYMLVPRHLRRPINERVIADGSVYQAMDDQQIIDAVNYFKSEGVNCVAVSFVWSVINSVHEQRAKQIVKEMMPDAFICIGSEVYPQIREYTRTSTTVVNAYLSSVLTNYIGKIDDLFADFGVRYPVRYYQSNGGLAIGDAMKEKAVHAINSGPASAPQAALFAAKPFDIDNVITVDMGGTSFDITLTKKGQTNLNKNIDFLRYRIGTPMIQVETLGAGGGSIAHVNEQGLLEVGPQSAGSNPGPVCYGKGGELPTVTDVNLVLGYLNPDKVLGGAITLNKDLAYQSIQKHVAKPLDISVEKAAYGISRIVNQNMANGIRRVSVERGYDPRDFVLVCAGGAGGMHITALAEDMGITQVLVPKVASGLCAFGQVISDVKYNYLATHPLHLNEKTDLKGINAKYEELEDRGVAHLVEDGFAPSDISILRSAEVRYVGQIHECTIDVPSKKIDKAVLKQLLQRFHQRHEELFSYSELESEVELVNIESTLVARVDKPKIQQIAKGNGNTKQALLGTREMVFESDEGWIQANVFDGEKLQAGDIVVGPAVIEEPTTTLVLRPGWSAELAETACYRVRYKSRAMND